jgi:hypothetical protein
MSVRCAALIETPEGFPDESAVSWFKVVVPSNDTFVNDATLDSFGLIDADTLAEGTITSYVAVAVNKMNQIACTFRAWGLTCIQVHS